MEADGLRWSLLIIGSLVIVGLAVHGIWLSRKNSEKKSSKNKHKKDQEYQPSGWQSDDDFELPEDEVSENIAVDTDLKFDIDIDDDVPTLTDAPITSNEFDDLGVGAVRVVSSEPKVDDQAEAETGTSIFW